ncbi:MAG: ribosomal protein S19 family protein [Candidatus Pacearchaeota archaeon]|nr:ribosomal protein S19 family protein [Candidatus Pacearchaeota archaeon]
MAIETTKKQFTFRGKTIDELKTLDVREFAKYLKSRQRRAVLRQFQNVENFVSRAKGKAEKNKPIKTHKRALVIVPQMIGMKIQIHSGHAFVPVEILKEMLGHRLGEFVPTRSKIKHGSAGIGSTKGTRSQAKK